MNLLHHKSLGLGQPLIIVHGFLGSLDNWMTLAKRFSADYQVIMIDQRNHGKSFHSADFGYDEMVEDLERLIDALNLDNPILLGHSMGGKTVMQYAAYHPHKVDKLIVADIGPKMYPTHHDKILEGLQAIPINTIKSRNQADDLLSKYVTDPGIRVFLLKNLRRVEDRFEWKMNLPILIKNIAEVGKALDYHLPIETESLFIRGGSSNYILDEEFESIEDIFPNVQFETIDNAGHWLHAEQPEEFYNKVMKFLS